MARGQGQEAWDQDTASQASRPGLGPAPRSTSDAAAAARTGWITADRLYATGVDLRGDLRETLSAYPEIVTFDHRERESLFVEAMH
jgi:hypothetical protein